MDPGTAVALAGLALTVVLAVFGWWFTRSERELSSMREKLNDCERQHRQAREDYAHVREEIKDVRAQLDRSQTRVEELTREKMDLLLRLVERRDGSA